MSSGSRRKTAACHSRGSFIRRAVARQLPLLRPCAGRQRFLDHALSSLTQKCLEMQSRKRSCAAEIKDASF